MAMHFKVVGGGPAGLYLAYLMKRSHPDYAVRVIEQNPPDATYGFGVVLSGRALNVLSEDGEASAIGRLSARMERWNEQHIVHRGELVAIDGTGYAAVERLVMLHQLQSLCRETGVELDFNQRLERFDDSDCDVLVAADGANSALRDAYPLAFDRRVVDRLNYFAWYGVETAYAAHTLTFLQREGGTYCAHHYRYTPSKSTFVAEVDAHTWLASGMSTMTDDERKSLMEQVFADTLRGKPLISNRSFWRRWRLVTNGRWHYRNIVLIGDAQRSSHPSIGSGTRLAMEDAIALWRAFEAAGSDIASAFRRYERERRPVRDKLNRAAEKSIAWYEDMATKMALSPCEFAYDYLLRTGVMTRERLAKESPEFMRRLALAEPLS